MPINSKIFFRPPLGPTGLALLFFIAVGMLGEQSSPGQDKAVVRGKIEFDNERTQSWDGNRLVVPFEEISASLRQRIVHLPPYPKEFNTWKPEQRLAWEREFIESDAGKKFLEQRKKLFEAANVYEIKFEKDGSFVVYDVPAGVYGIQGRVDKQFGDSKYGFEVFGQIEVLDDVDELVLKPLRIEITPIIEPQQTAPPINVQTHDGKTELSLDTFKDHKYLFVNFWTSASPTAAADQKRVQEMYDSLKEKLDLKLLSINVDPDREKSLDYIIKNELKLGSHGFTQGLEHRTLFDYGVRGIPSFWLIGQNGKVLMTQYEIAQAMRVKSSLAVIIADRIEGKDQPTPAEPAGDGQKKD